MIGGHAAAAGRSDEAKIVQTGTAALDGRQRSGAAVGVRRLTSTTKTQVFGSFSTVVNGPLGAPFSFFFSFFLSPAVTTPLHSNASALLCRLLYVYPLRLPPSVTFHPSRPSSYTVVP